VPPCPPDVDPDDCVAPAEACAFDEDCPSGQTCDFGVSPSPSPRFVDNSNGTVTDRKTCLVWEQKDGADDTEDLTDAHDVDNTYTWTDQADSDSTNADGTAFTDFLVKLNGGTGFTGHTDWRLPTSAGTTGAELTPTGQRAELESIVDTSVTGCNSDSPCINAIFGPTQPSHYWTSSTSANDAGRAWFVDFFAGDLNVEPKSFPNSVRAVRGGP